MCEYIHLQELRLNNFTFGQEAVESLTAAVELSSGLQILDLSWNTIVTKDFVKLTEKMMTNKKLKEVSFRGIPCSKFYSDEIAENFYNFIRSNKSLQHIDIGHMYLSDSVCVRIIEAVAKSRSLLAIHLTGNHIESDETRQKMRDLLKPRKRLKKHTEILEGKEYRQYVNLGSDSSDKEYEKKEWQQKKLQSNPTNSIKHQNEVRLP